MATPTLYLGPRRQVIVVVDRGPFAYTPAFIDANTAKRKIIDRAAHNLSRVLSRSSSRRSGRMKPARYGGRNCDLRRNSLMRCCGSKPIQALPLARWSLEHIEVILARS
jgi:hypothetical protein